jgi:hypothetical protein
MKRDEKHLSSGWGDFGVRLSRCGPCRNALRSAQGGLLRKHTGSIR